MREENDAASGRWLLLLFHSTVPNKLFRGLHSVPSAANNTTNLLAVTKDPRFKVVEHR